jgi:hypothetical protein
MHRRLALVPVSVLVAARPLSSPTLLREHPLHHHHPNQKENTMPLFMDTHHLDNAVTFDDVAAAHLEDLKVQGDHGVSYKTFWVSEADNTIHCLVEAPNAEAAHEVHRLAHGLVADTIVEVQEGS